jgi:hypothetical protein
MFQWPVVHHVIAVGIWMEKIGKSPRCAQCSCNKESNRHSLWHCGQSQQIWRRVLQINTFGSPQKIVTWGLTAWSTTDPYVAKYEDVEDVLNGLLIDKGRMTISEVTFERVK